MFQCDRKLGQLGRIKLIVGVAFNFVCWTIDKVLTARTFDKPLNNVFKYIKIIIDLFPVWLIN